MAKFQQSLVITVLLAMSASLCLAGIVGAAEDGSWAEGPSVADGPAYHFALTPAVEEFIENIILQNKLRKYSECGDRLNQGGLDKCVETVFEGVSQRKSPTADRRCCQNVLAVDRGEPGCWDVFFPDEKMGRALVPDLVGYCSQLVQSIRGGPWFRKFLRHLA